MLAGQEIRTTFWPTIDTGILLQSALGRNER
jgi:hypothetical protein